MKRQAGGLIEAVEFIVVGWVGAQILVSLFDDHVAGGARAAASAGVFDMDAEVDGDV